MTQGLPLGFGCSRLMGSLTRMESDRLLETALSVGITHFDVARGYGSGEAEVVVGAFAQRHPDEVTLTTKFGISPSAAQQSRLLRATARKIMRRSPVARRRIQQRGARMVSRGLFDLASTRTSVEQSLAALGVPTIHGLLLHDPRGEDVLAPETLDWLRSLQGRGAIGRLGIGTGHEEASMIIETQPEIAEVVQVPHGLATSAAAIFRQAPGTTIAHGVVSGAMSLYALQPARVASALAKSGCKADDTYALAAIAIAEAIDAGADRVLISTTDHQRLPRLVKSIEINGTTEQVETYRELVALTE